MCATVDELGEPLGIEPHHEIVAVGDRGDPRAPGQRAPLPQEFHIFGDIELLECAVVLAKPILGLPAVGSRGCGIDTDGGHGWSPIGGWLQDRAKFGRGEEAGA